MVAFLGPGNPPVVVGLGETRVYLQSLIVIGDGHIMVAFVCPGESTVVVGIGIAWVYVEHPGISHYRFIVLIGNVERITLLKPVLGTQIFDCLAVFDLLVFKRFPFGFGQFLFQALNFVQILLCSRLRFLQVFALLAILAQAVNCFDHIIRVGLYSCLEAVNISIPMLGYYFSPNNSGSQANNFVLGQYTIFDLGDAMEVSSQFLQEQPFYLFQCDDPASELAVRLTCGVGVFPFKDFTGGKRLDWKQQKHDHQQ